MLAASNKDDSSGRKMMDHFQDSKLLDSFVGGGCDGGMVNGRKCRTNVTNHENYSTNAKPYDKNSCKEGNSHEEEEENDEEDDDDDSWLNQPSGIICSSTPSKSSLSPQSSQESNYNNNLTTEKEERQTQLDNAPSFNKTDKKTNKQAIKQTISTATDTSDDTTFKTVTGSHKMTETSNDTAAPSAMSNDQIEELARKRAQAIVDDTLSMYDHDFRDNSLCVQDRLKWHILKSTRKSFNGGNRNAKNKKKVTMPLKALPCYLVPSSSHREQQQQQQQQQNICSNKGGKVVRYLGYKHTDWFKYYKVSESSLRPFFKPSGVTAAKTENVDVDAVADADANANANVTDKICKNDTNSDVLMIEGDMDEVHDSRVCNDITGTATNECKEQATAAITLLQLKEKKKELSLSLDYDEHDFEMMMNIFIRNTISNQKCFTSSALVEENKFSLRTEHYVVQYLVEKLIQRHSGDGMDCSHDDSILCTQMNNAQSNSGRNTNETLPHDAYTDNETESTNHCTMKRNEDDYKTEINGETNDDDHMHKDHPRIKSILTPTTAHTTTPSTGIIQRSETTKKQYRYLRAGDVIQYNAPLQRVCKESLCQAVVLNCYPPSSNAPNEDIAIETSNNDFLTRDDQVRIMKRYLRGEVHDCNGSQNFHDVTYFRLDPINNGKELGLNPQLMTRNKLLAKTYKDAIDDIDQMYTKGEYAMVPNEIDSTQTSPCCDNIDNVIGQPLTSSIVGDVNCHSSIVQDTTSRSKKRSLSMALTNDENQDSTSVTNKQCELPSMTNSIDKAEAANCWKENDHSTQTVPVAPTRSIENNIMSKNDKKKSNYTASTPWLRNLEQRLLEVQNEMQKRRCNYERCMAEQNAIRTAIDVRHRVQDLARMDYPVEDIVMDISDQFEETEEKLWNYLLGNPKSALSVRHLNELTVLWKGWLETEQTSMTRPESEPTQITSPEIVDPECI